MQQQGDSYIFEGIDPTANGSLQQQQQQQQQYDLGIYEETIQSDNYNLFRVQHGWKHWFKFIISD